MTLTEARTGQHVGTAQATSELTASLGPEPATPGAHCPGVLMVIPVHGLTPHMEVVADRLAAQGYVSFRPRCIRHSARSPSTTSGHRRPRRWSYSGRHF